MSVGSRITQARSHAGLSVEHLADKTRLRTAVITQFESDDFLNSESDVYLRAHLRSIAKVLGISEQELLAEYESQSGVVSSQPGSVAAVADPNLNIFRVAKTEALPKRRSGKPFVIAGIVILILVVVGMQVLTRGRSDAQPIITLSASPTDSSSTGTSPAPTNAQGVDPNIVTVVLKANARCWVEITASNGQKIYSAMINAGETRAFTDPSALTVLLGNVSGVEVKVNGYDVVAPAGGQNVSTITYGLGEPTPQPVESSTPTESSSPSESPTPSQTA
jgi:cytoskeletal protein RodZ